MSLAGSSAVTSVFQGSAASCNPNGVNQQSITPLFPPRRRCRRARQQRRVHCHHPRLRCVSPPTPPTGLSGGQGETRIHLNWTDSFDTDIAGYDFFCDPPIGSSNRAARPPSEPSRAARCSRTPRLDAAVSGGNDRQQHGHDQQQPVPRREHGHERRRSQRERELQPRFGHSARR